MEYNLAKRAIYVRYGTDARTVLNEAVRAEVQGAILLHVNSKSECLRQFSEHYQLELNKISTTQERFNRWGEYFNAARLARSRLKGRKLYKHYSAAHQGNKLLDLLKGNFLTYSVMKIFHYLSYQRYLNDQVVEQLRSENINEIWIVGYSSATSLSVAVSAKNAGVKTICYINSWKDYYVNDFIPPAFDEVRVWSQPMRNRYLSKNSHLKPNQITVSGNPRLTSLYRHIPNKKLAYYQKKYRGLPDTFILFTAINPKVYESDPELVKMIASRFVEDMGVDAPGILIKPNPMDGDFERWQSLSDTPGIYVVDSAWEWDADKDFNMPSLDSDLEWFDLLKHCTCTMNVASTVTVESLVCGKPVVNIGFDHLGQESPVFHRYTYAPFYEPILKRDDIFFVKDVSNLVSAYKALIPRKAGENIETIIEVS